MTVTDFLLARLAEDEAVAKAANDFPWIEPDDAPWVRANATRDLSKSDAMVAQFALPARALAECEAKRRLIDWAAPVIDWERVETDRPGVYDKRPVRHVNEDGEDVLRILAAPYRLHPDWRDEWAL